ncbi:DUF3710 domain-containing protein [Nocardia sp. CA-135398]|uniref:DUF3710 domain-containing protein n=1 Tax=Nocardia sp. CA-135398 TaxID=3239977 RepID=UPI003D990A49
MTGPGKPVSSPGGRPPGPFDEKDAPDDRLRRLDLGSVRVPIPDGSKLLLDMADYDQIVRAVHWRTPLGKFTVGAFAAPSSGGLWNEVRPELIQNLRSDGYRASSESGPWGEEVSAVMGDLVLRFVAADGPGWMARATVAGPPDSAEQSASALRNVLRGTVVVRGTDDLPLRTPLPLVLPLEIFARLSESPVDEERFRPVDGVF